MVRLDTQELLSILQPSDELSTKHLEALPDLLPVASSLKFDVTLNGDNNNWLFHPKLQKIFIKMSSVMNINVLHLPTDKPLFLRAMILFSNENEMHLPVKRCANHRQQDGVPHCTEHILRCTHPKAYYGGVENGTIFKERFSVVAPLDNAVLNEDEMACMNLGFEFMCQNSCSSGINRKSTSIVFTLEDENFVMLGKKAIQFKVCSCPRRDCEREMPLKKKSSGTDAFPKGKRPKYSSVAPLPMALEDIKMEPSDSDAPPSPEEMAESKPLPTSGMVKMPEPDGFKFVLECAYNKVAGDMARNGNEADKYIKYLRYYKKMLEPFEKMEREKEIDE